MLVEPSPKQLEDTITRRTGGAAVADAVGTHPAAEELEAMLGLSEEIGALPSQGPAGDARSRIREIFLQGGETHRVAWVHSHALRFRPAKHPLPAHGIRWGLVVAVALLLALAAGITLALAAQLAEPDSSLYPLKLNTERLLVAVNRAPAGRAAVHLEVSNQRFRDAESMAAVGKGNLSVAAMRAYYDQLRLAGSDLAAAKQDASWKSVRDQFDKAEAKPIDEILLQLRNTRQTAALSDVKALADKFAADRKNIDAKLHMAAPPGNGGQPQPLPSGAQPQPGGVNP